MAKTSTRTRSTWPVAAMSLSAALLFAAGASRAAPLEPEACAALSAERTALLADGVEADMAKGAAWARHNLAEDRLALIKKLIEVNEQLSFRCGIMVTERPALIQRTPPPATLTTTEPDGAEKPKKQTKSKPKTEASAPAGLPGTKKKPKPATEASASPKKAPEAPKVPEAEKQPSVEKAGN